MKTIAFFNNKGGVGKTSLVYHLAWMYAELGLSVVAADLDPQANLTSMFLDEDRLAALWPDSEHPNTVYGALQPLLDGTGDLANPHVEPVSANIGLLVGDLALSVAEDELTAQWPQCMDRKARAFRVMSALWRLVLRAAQQRSAELVLIDVGPNLGALNRAALISAQYVVIPLAADLYSLQGLKNLGPTLRRWRSEWTDRLPRNPVVDLQLPEGSMQSVGYVLMQHAIRLDRPVQAYQRWIERIPQIYRSAVLDVAELAAGKESTDPNQLAALKHYRSLMPLAQEARKPMFKLKPADGALGGHFNAVGQCFTDFETLALEIARRCDIVIAR